MPETRIFAETPATVTVGLVDGQSKTGTVSAVEDATPLGELQINDDGLRRAIQTGRPAADLRALSIEGRMRTLLQDGIRKCLEGLTDLRQVRAVCSR